MVDDPYLPERGQDVPDQPASVSERITGLISKDDSYMAAARTGAKQAAEKRGLLSSSIAATAGEKAAIEAALPIAQQEAAQAQARNLAAQEFRQSSTLQQESAAQRGELLAADIAGQKGIQQEAATQREELLTMDIAGKEALQTLDTASKERIAALNVASHDKDKAMSVAAVMESSYADMFRTVSGSPDIPADKRTEYMTHIGKIRDSSLNLLEQMYNVDLTWATPAV